MSAVQNVLVVGGGLAEPVGLAGEVAADLVGVQVGLGVQVADADLGQLPPVAGGLEELLQHRQVGPDRRGAGSSPAFFKIFQTVEAAMGWPSPTNSPWMRL